MTEVAVHATPRERTGLAWSTVTITSVALLVVAADNLVVTTALPAIQRDFTASVESLAWSVNAYVLAFAVFLLLGARLGDRYGHRRMVAVGLAIFTAASAACAIAPSIELFDAARAVQGLGGAIVAAPALTALGNVFPDERRAIATGLWWSIGGFGVLLGPLVGGAIVDRFDWQWMFWLDVPIGIAAIAFALVGLRETHGPHARFDVPGLTLAAAGLFGIVWGLTRGHVDGWTSQQVAPALGAGAILTAAFVVWELGASDPMLPRSLFRRRGFASASAVSLLLSFGLFGAVFLLVQFLQLVRGESALRAGLATVPAISAMLLVAPLAAVLSTRLGARPFVALGLLVQTAALGWLAHAASIDVGYMRLLPGFVLLGGGLGLVLPPTAYLVLGSGRPGDVAPASCTINAIRSTGGALGIAALLAVVMSNGGYGSASAFTDGLVRALWVASAVAAVGTLGSMLIPGRKRGVHEVAATVVREPAGYPVLPPEESVAVAETHEPTDPDPAHVPTVETFPCPVCLGHGEFTFTPPRDPHTDTCPRCYGHGTVLTGSHVPAHLVRDCPDCQGLGYVETRMLHEDLRIRREVPAGSPPPLEEHVPDELHES